MGLALDRLFRFREDQWSRIEPLLPPATRTGAETRSLIVG
jgi:hypothetical protein